MRLCGWGAGLSLAFICRLVLEKTMVSLDNWPWESPLPLLLHVSWAGPLCVWSGWTSDGHGTVPRTGGWMEAGSGLWMPLTIPVLYLLVYSVQHVAVSSGSGKDDLEKMSNILEAVPQVKFICLDVANGYSEHFVEFVKLVRSRFPEHTIMVSVMGWPSRWGSRKELHGVLGELCSLGSFWCLLSRRIVENQWEKHSSSCEVLRSGSAIQSKIQINAIGCRLLVSAKYHQVSHTIWDL